MDPVLEEHHVDITFVQADLLQCSHRSIIRRVQVLRVADSDSVVGREFNALEQVRVQVILVPIVRYEGVTVLGSDLRYHLSRDDLVVGVLRVDLV